jgi:hypothetical protein
MDFFAISFLSPWFGISFLLAPGFVPAPTPALRHYFKVVVFY